MDPEFWRRTVEVIAVLGPTTGAAVGAGIVVKKLWNGNNAAMRDLVRGQEEQGRINQSHWEETSHQIARHSLMVSEKLGEMGERVARIEGSCVIHNTKLNRRWPGAADDNGGD